MKVLSLKKIMIRSIPDVCRTSFMILVWFWESLWDFDPVPARVVVPILDCVEWFGAISGVWCVEGLVSWKSIFPRDCPCWFILCDSRGVKLSVKSNNDPSAFCWLFSVIVVVPLSLPKMMPDSYSMHHSFLSQRGWSSPVTTKLWSVWPYCRKLNGICCLYLEATNLDWVSGNAAAFSQWSRSWVYSGHLGCVRCSMVVRPLFLQNVKESNLPFLWIFPADLSCFSFFTKLTYLCK